MACIRCAHVHTMHTGCLNGFCKLKKKKEKGKDFFKHNINVSDLLLMRTKLLIEYILSIIFKFNIYIYIYTRIYTLVFSLSNEMFNHFISPLLPCNVNERRNFILRSFSHNSLPSSIHSKNSSPRTKQILFSFFHFHNLTPPRTRANFGSSLSPSCTEFPYPLSRKHGTNFTRLNGGNFRCENRAGKKWRREGYFSRRSKRREGRRGGGSSSVLLCNRFCV